VLTFSVLILHSVGTYYFFLVISYVFNLNQQFNKFNNNNIDDTNIIFDKIFILIFQINKVYIKTIYNPKINIIRTVKLQIVLVDSVSILCDYKNIKIKSYSTKNINIKFWRSTVFYYKIEYKKQTLQSVDNEFFKHLFVQFSIIKLKQILSYISFLFSLLINGLFDKRF